MTNNLDRLWTESYSQTKLPEGGIKGI